MSFWKQCSLDCHCRETNWVMFIFITNLIKPVVHVIGYIYSLARNWNNHSRNMIVITLAWSYNIKLQFQFANLSFERPNWLISRGFELYRDWQCLVQSYVPIILRKHQKVFCKLQLQTLKYFKWGNHTITQKLWHGFKCKLYSYKNANKSFYA